MSISRQIEDLYSNARQGNKTASSQLETLLQSPDLILKEQIRLNYILAQCFLHGYGTAPNAKKAYVYFKTASDLGDINSTLFLAVLSVKGEGVRVDFNIAYEKFFYAIRSQPLLSEHVHAKACFAEFELVAQNAKKRTALECRFVALCYLYGYGTNIKLEKAREFFEIAIQKQDDESMCHLATMIEQGLLSDCSLEKALHLYFLAAKRNTRNQFGTLFAVQRLTLFANHQHPEGNFFLALCYLHGHGVTSNSQIAKSYLERAASLNHDIAMAELGMLYEAGVHTKKNLETAAYWYFKSVNQESKNPSGSLLAFHKLKKLAIEDCQHGSILYWYAMCLFEGKGVEKNKEQAYELFKASAKLLYSPAEIMLGHRRATGDGVKRSMNKAADWYLCAAQRATPLTIEVNNPVAILQKLAAMPNPHDRVLRNLAICYQNGYVVERSPTKAIEILRLRAERLFNAICENEITRKNPHANLYLALNEYFAIYHTIIGNQIILLRNTLNDLSPAHQEKGKEIHALLAIMQPIATIDIQALVKNVELKRTLKESHLTAAKDYLTLLNHYDFLLSGIKRIDEQTKACLLALKIDIAHHSFKIANWRWKCSPLSTTPEFIPGTPGGIEEIKTILADMKESSDSNDVRIAWLKIFDVIENRAPKKRHDSTIVFYIQCKSKLLECRLFTSVAQATALLSLQHVNATTPQIIPREKEEENSSIEMDNSFSDYVHQAGSQDSQEGSPSRSPLLVQSLFASSPQVNRPDAGLASQKTFSPL